MALWFPPTPAWLSPTEFFAMSKKPTIKEILLWIEMDRESAERHFWDACRIGWHTCYWAGVEWWNLNTLNRLEYFILWK